MRKIIKLILSISTLMSFIFPASAFNYADYQSVAKATKVFYLDENDENSPTLTIEYNLYALPTADDDLFTSYALQTIAYFSENGNDLEITHYVYNADINFEANETSTVRLLGNNNRFLAFFSGIDRIDNGSLVSSDKHKNKWELKRRFYAYNRYFNSSYTFKTITYFSISVNNDVQIYIDVEGSFIDEKIDLFTIPIEYKCVNK